MWKEAVIVQLEGPYLYLPEGNETCHENLLVKMVDFPTEIRIGYITNRSQKPYPLIQPAASPIGTVALNFADKMLPAGSGSLYCQVVFQELLHACSLKQVSQCPLRGCNM